MARLNPHKQLSKASPDTMISQPGPPPYVSATATSGTMLSSAASRSQLRARDAKEMWDMGRRTQNKPGENGGRGSHQAGPSPYTSSQVVPGTVLRSTTSHSLEAKKILKKSPMKAVCATCGQEGPEDQLKSRRHLETKVHLACEWWSEGVELMFRDPMAALNKFHEATKGLKKTHIKWRRGITDAILLAREITILSTRPIQSSGSKFREPSMTATADMQQWLQHLSSCGNVYARLCLSMWEHVKKYRITDTTLANWRAVATGFGTENDANSHLTPAIIIDKEVMDGGPRYSPRYSGLHDQQMQKAGPAFESAVPAHTTPPIMREPRMSPTSLFTAEIAKQQHAQQLESECPPRRSPPPLPHPMSQQPTTLPSQDLRGNSVPSIKSETNMVSQRQLVSTVPFEMESEGNQEGSRRKMPLLNHLQDNRSHVLTVPKKNGNPMEPMLLPKPPSARGTPNAPLSLSLSQNKIACPRCGTRVRFLRYNNGKLCIDKASLVKHLLNSCARVGLVDGEGTLGRLIRVLKSAKVVRKKQRITKPGEEPGDDDEIVHLCKPMPLSMRDVQNADISRLMMSPDWYEGAEKDLVMLRREVDVISSVIQSSHYYLKQNGLLQNHVPPPKDSPKRSGDKTSPTSAGLVGPVESLPGVTHDLGSQNSQISQYRQKNLGRIPFNPNSDMSMAAPRNFNPNSDMPMAASRNFNNNPTGHFQGQVNQHPNIFSTMDTKNKKMRNTQSPFSGAKWKQAKRGMGIADAFPAMHQNRTSVQTRPKDKRDDSNWMVSPAAKFLGDSHNDRWSKSYASNFGNARLNSSRAETQRMDRVDPVVHIKNEIHASPSMRPMGEPGPRFSKRGGNIESSRSPVGVKRKRKATALELELQAKVRDLQARNKFLEAQATAPATTWELQLQSKVESLQARNKILQARVTALENGGGSTNRTKNKHITKPKMKSKAKLRHDKQTMLVTSRERKTQPFQQSGGEIRRKKAKQPSKSSTSKGCSKSRKFESGDGSLEGMALQTLAALCHDQTNQKPKTSSERKKKIVRRKPNKTRRS